MASALFFFCFVCFLRNFSLPQGHGGTLITFTKLFVLPFHLNLVRDSLSLYGPE